MAPIVTAKKSGKEIVLAVSITIGVFIGRCCGRKQPEHQRADMVQFVSSLEDCLRKVEIELMRANILSPSRIQALKGEKTKLLAEIDAVSRAAGIRHRICYSSFQ
ncbi:MAG: hypothetical protein JW832_16395 [Deltaproteobacteria bacterium]|nr:hypothetical protein [Deltaproteobacteria bacterium]